MSARCGTLGAVALVVAWLAPGMAQAQAPRIECNAPALIEGSPAWILAADARRTHAQRYGVVGTLDEVVLPKLRQERDEEDEVFVLHISSENLFGALKLPAVAKGDSGCKGGLGLYDYDLNAANMALGYRYEWFRLFYAASGNAGYTVSDGALRYLQWLILTGVTEFYSLTAPLWGSAVVEADPVQSFALDYVAGVGLDLWLVDVEAGYMGSGGLYLDVSEPRLSVFARSLLDFDQPLSEAPYLEAGFNTLSWLVGQHALGATGLSARRIQYASLEALGPDNTLSKEDQVNQQINFTTVRIDQRNAFERFDLSASAAISPEPLLHEVRLGYHTEGFHVDPYAGKEVRWRRERVEFGGYLGVVEFPAMRHYGLKGGKHLVAGGELVYIQKSSSFDQLHSRVVLSTNDPGTLDIFPYAVGAWRLHLSITGVSF